MKPKALSIGIVGLMLVSMLTACGGDSSPEPTVTVAPTATNTVEPTGEPSDEVLIPTDPPEDEAYVPSTPWVEGERTPPVNLDVGCRYVTSTLEFQDIADFRGEVIACNDEFTWPVGYELDAARFAFNDPGPAGGEVGSGRAVITLFNACAWGTAWLDATEAGDQAVADDAIQYMLNTWPTWQSNFGTGADSFLRGFIEKAALGDPSGIIQWVNSGDCLFYEEMRLNP